MSFGFFPFFQQPTEEELAEQRKQKERFDMQMEEFRHGHQRLFEELSEDQLFNLRTMLQVLAGGSGDDTRQLAASWEGQASMALKMRFNICVACSVNHDNELQEGTRDEKGMEGNE